MDEIPWLAVSLAATAEGVDWVRMALAAVASQTKISLADFKPEFNPGLDPEGAWDYNLQFGFADTWAGRSQLQACLAKLAPLERSGLIASPAIDQVSTPTEIINPSVLGRIGAFVIALPPSESEDAVELNPGEIPLYLPASLGFGSGSHPATILSLRLIQRYWSTYTSLAQPQVLDLGCGSGILSLACARLGGKVLAIDNDPVAVQATQNAVDVNGLEQQISVQAGSLGRGSDFGHWLGSDISTEPTKVAATGFELLVANVLARLHLSLAQDYVATLNLGGYVITAGYTADYEAQLNADFAAVGLVLVNREAQQDWVALMHQRES